MSPETPESEPPPKTVVPHVLCDCCSRIVKKSEIIQAFAAGRLEEYMDGKIKSEWFLHNHSVNYLSKPSAAGCHLCSLAVTGTRDSNATSVRGSLFSTPTNSPESISTARAWIDDCLRNHPKCHRKPFDMSSTEHGLLPTRLIDIGTVDGKLAPRLILTSTFENKSIQYLTLSHSWAITSNDSTLKLTSRNLELLRVHIPIDGLPRTFQDAMEITRRLGYQYLWIDSLCIMQDSESDWHREALAMSSIYGNSACNIAALGVDGADACFIQRNPLQVFPCRITQQEDGTSVYADRRREWNTPLLRRGWVMQERLLSPRVLYTGASRLFWECFRGYQRTEFTHESDRLIALSGVAKAIEQSKGFTYVAGTWKELWPLDLLWVYQERNPSKEEQTGFTKSKAPSWSWASGNWAKKFLLLDDMNFQLFQINHLADVKEFTCPTSTARYIGTRADEEEITLTIKSRVKRWLATRRSRFQHLLFGVRTSDKDWVYIYWDPDQTPNLGESVLLLILISGRTTESDHLQAGLALTLEEGLQNKKGQPCYRRVGYFEGGLSGRRDLGRGNDLSLLMVP
ncbi:heterokaryon incompatibility protein-domain-containing protein [Neurospora crassa]|nr:heterokaryon incompatibility protein-domain-containing protein [Neurospora crassa]